MKKLTTLLLALILCFSATLITTSCKKEKTTPYTILKEHIENNGNYINSATHITLKNQNNTLIEIQNNHEVNKIIFIIRNINEDLALNNYVYLYITQSTKEIVWEGIYNYSQNNLLRKTTHEGILKPENFTRETNTITHNTETNNGTLNKTETAKAFYIENIKNLLGNIEIYFIQKNLNLRIKDFGFTNY